MLAYTKGMKTKPTLLFAFTLPALLVAGACITSPDNGIDEAVLDSEPTPEEAKPPQPPQNFGADCSAITPWCPYTYVWPLDPTKPQTCYCFCDEQSDCAGSPTHKRCGTQFDVDAVTGAMTFTFPMGWPLVCQLGNPS